MRGYSYWLLAATCLTSAAVAEDLGIIQVESSTISDRFEDKRSEPSNIGAISGEELERAHPENIQQVLQRIPGITTEVQSGDSLKIHIRGVENQVYMGEKPGVAIVIDGVPVFERTGKVNIDLDNIESIKVVKGGASYLFGDDALAGAVIITTKRGAKYAGYKLGAEAGSYGYRKGLARAGFSGENANGHVQVSTRQTDGYHDDSGSQADYLNGKLQYYLSDISDVTFGVELSEREKNSHGSVKGVTAAALDPKSEDPAYNDYANHFDVNLAKYFVTYSRDTSADANLLVNAYQYGDETKFDSAPLDANPDIYSQANDYEQVQRGVKTEYRSGGQRLAWMAGLDLRDNRYENQTTYLDCSERTWDPTCAVGALSGDNATDEEVRAIYAETKFQVTAPLTITLNGRVDQIDLEYTDNLDATLNGTKDFDVSSWRIGANYAVSPTFDVYSNVSTGFRAPTVEQLFVGSANPSVAVAANPDLEPEEAVNMEIGIRRRARWMDVPVDLDLAVFQIDRSDHIQASAGQYTTAAGNRYENVGDVRHRGLELSLMTDPARTFSFDVAYTYLDAYFTRYNDFYLQTINPAYDPTCSPFRPPFLPCAPKYVSTQYDNTGNQVPRVPRHHLNLVGHYRPAQHWLISAEADAISSYYADEINQEKIGGHTVYNLVANYDRRYGNTDWSFFARIDNLFDKQYYNTARGHGDSNEDTVYDQEDLSIVVNPGRTYTIGLSVGF